MCKQIFQAEFRFTWATKHSISKFLDLFMLHVPLTSFAKGHDFSSNLKRLKWHIHQPVRDCLFHGFAQTLALATWFHCVLSCNDSSPGVAASVQHVLAGVMVIMEDGYNRVGGTGCKDHLTPHPCAGKFDQQGKVISQSGLFLFQPWFVVINSGFPQGFWRITRNEFRQYTSIMYGPNRLKYGTKPFTRWSMCLPTTWWLLQRQGIYNKQLNLNLVNYNTSLANFCKYFVYVIMGLINEQFKTMR